MKLWELFDDGPLDVTNDIRQSLLDILTPMVAAKVPFITFQQIIEKLNELRSGISIDRNLVTTLLDPDKVKMIDRIEGDRVYFSDPNAPDRKLKQDDRETEAQHVDNLAAKQAQKSMSKDDAPV